MAETIYDLIEFETLDDRQKAEFYFKMKGIAFHRIILNYLHTQESMPFPIK